MSTPGSKPRTLWLTLRCRGLVTLALSGVLLSLLAVFAAAPAGDTFGQSVAVSGDTVVIGAPSTNSSNGATCIYRA
jgi:hypothetical protein